MLVSPFLTSSTENATNSRVEEEMERKKVRKINTKI